MGITVLPGQRLRTMRERLGLTLRDVEAASHRIAARHNGNDEFVLGLSRLADIETKGIIPSIHRLYSLACIYGLDFLEMVCWYGVDFDDAAQDLNAARIATSHLAKTLAIMPKVEIPVRLDPQFELRKTTNLSRMIERWGSVPMAYLHSLAADQRYAYGYIGSEDFTMYPILLPGSFVQVDESRNSPVMKTWRSEYERPIYFVELRDGFACCWCSVERSEITLQPHPLSPVRVRKLPYPTQAEIIGQVVGIAMRLDEWFPPETGRASSTRPALQ